ncbi:MAG: NAD(+) kinase [Gammaproteobacteria bacterium]|nr:NAD(+) kinase [Gammaproteobacteria bacterium]
MQVFSRVGLVARSVNEQIGESLLLAERFLLEKDRQVYFEHIAAKALGKRSSVSRTLEEIGECCDLVIAVGGDGNILNCARKMAPCGVPILGINRGKLGFLADVSPEEIEESVGEVLLGNYSVQEHFLLEGRVEGLDETPSALNEVLLHSVVSPRMIEMEIYHNEQYVFTQNSDGLIVSSPTGSTAYALSAGGPIMCPDLDAIVLIPMFPHSLTNRPLVVPADGEIRIVLGKEKDMKAKVSFDSHLEFRIGAGDSLLIKKKEDKLRMVHPPNHSFFEVCRSKLDWASRTTRD